jgi:aerobic-type carbon monoxide dehydrogenase small subunit (CoxS/CutS family)
MTDERDDAEDAARVDVGRRNFFKGAGLAGAGAAVADLLLLRPGTERGSTHAAQSEVPGAVAVALVVNGEKRSLRVEPRTTLLNALRDHLDPPVTGPKLVCDQGSCGACTVMFDGRTALSCLVLAVDVGDRKVTTVEGLGGPDHLSVVQASFVEHDAQMCGFCTPGFVTSVSALLDRTPDPTLDDVREACRGNFCRCGTYTRVFEAALAAARQARAGRRG